MFGVSGRGRKVSGSAGWDETDRREEGFGGECSYSSVVEWLGSRTRTGVSGPEAFWPWFSVWPPAGLLLMKKKRKGQDPEQEEVLGALEVAG